MFYRHIWGQGELERCCNEAYENNHHEVNRFGGLLLPFLGGLLIGGLFIPRPNNIPQPYPQYIPYQYPQYYPGYIQPVPYTYEQN